MALLAIETCFGAVSAAVQWADGPGTVHVRAAYEEMDIGHAERLMPMIRGVMADAQVRFSALDALAVTVGPGGFTGLRVGVSAARGLALAADVPVHGTSSLAVMARRAIGELRALPRDHVLAVIVDARRDALYVQLFDAAGARALTEPQLASVGQAVALCVGRKIVAVGTGAQLLAAAAGSYVTVALPRLQPDARTLLQMMPSLPRLDPVQPLYLRAPDAKPQADKALPRAHL
jgi:tRNA threonylcarbamoyladenosine biosynthesis protein TsaB